MTDTPGAAARPRGAHALPADDATPVPAGRAPGEPRTGERSTASRSARAALGHVGRHRERRGLPGPVAPVAPDAPSVGQLVASASSDLSALVKDEIALAKAELADSAKHAGKGAGLLGAAGYLGHLAVVLLSFALVYVLVALGLPTWASFAVVAAVYLLLAGVLALVARRSLKGAKAPERTMRTVKRLPEALKPRRRQAQH